MRSTNNSPLKSATKTSAPATAAAVSSPSLEYIRAVDALALLEIAGNAAIALATMNANLINETGAAAAGWEVFDMPSIKAGMVELPRLLDQEFDIALSAWREEITGKSKTPDSVRNRVDIENIVCAINHLVELQGNEITNRSQSGAFHASCVVRDRLQAAFDEAWKAWGNLASSVRSEKPIDTWRGHLAVDFSPVNRPIMSP